MPQRSVLSLLRKTKREFYGNDNEKDVIDNKTVQKTVKRFLSDKTTQNKVRLITHEVKVVETLNTFHTELLWV